MRHIELKLREVLIYITQQGRAPFEEWLEGLKDKVGRSLIRKRLNRIRLGNIGNVRGVGEGVQELRLNYGPGYRVYFAEDGPHIVVLLAGGDKGSQNRDIAKAKEYWRDYNA